jgi:hypothetical protein
MVQSIKECCPTFRPDKWDKKLNEVITSYRKLENRHEKYLGAKFIYEKLKQNTPRLWKLKYTSKNKSSWHYVLSVFF